jgi:DNA-binding NarL/FixJ family response regulator
MKVLVVDDEPGVRAALQRALAMLEPRERLRLA